MLQGFWCLVLHDRIKTWCRMIGDSLFISDLDNERVWVLNVNRLEENGGREMLWYGGCWITMDIATKDTKPPNPLLQSLEIKHVEPVYYCF